MQPGKCGKMFEILNTDFFFLPVLGFELSASLLSHVSSPFCSGYFADKISLFTQAVLDCVF
jgi:hypothetical protein